MLHLIATTNFCIGKQKKNKTKKILSADGFDSRRDITKLITELNELFAKQWQNQMQTLTKTLEKLHQTPSFPFVNNIPLPQFSGDARQDVNSFLRQFNLTAVFYKLNNFQKADMLPLLLTGNANVWFSASTLSSLPYDQLCEALKKQFHTESDICLLRQQLLNKKQSEMKA